MLDDDPHVLLRPGQRHESTGALPVVDVAREDGGPRVVTRRGAEAVPARPVGVLRDLHEAVIRDADGVERHVQPEVGDEEPDGRGRRGVGLVGDRGVPGARSLLHDRATVLRGRRGGDRVHRGACCLRPTRR
ncbi:hypothetical protein BJF86_07130 [Serinicoccus sp. CNJ-927]|nr:hypothetical protein [Serinicoccus sp. CNJ-927]OLT39622.1 hypothetical protein BJF86_07130 [Serinicoccus sp. CNJ-927]